VIMPSSTCEPSSTFVPSSVPVMVSSSYDDSEDDNPHPPSHLPPNECFEHEPTPAPPLPRWVHSIREEVGDLVGDPSYLRQRRSQLQRASSLLAQVSETHDPETFA
jgi:hypothetical protein